MAKRSKGRTGASRAGGWKWGAVLGVSIVVAACTDPLVYDDLSGDFSGSFTSVEPGGQQFDGVFSLSLTQVEGAVTGSFEIDGTIMGQGSVETTTTGGVVATIPLGEHPTFQVDIAYSFCPQDTIGFAASFDSSTETLTLVGDLDIPNSSCNVLTAYPINVALTR